jgi:hypothetical protein
MDCLLPPLDAAYDSEMHAAAHAWGLGDILWDPVAMVRAPCRGWDGLPRFARADGRVRRCRARAAQEAALRLGDGWDAGCAEGMALEPLLARGGGGGAEANVQYVHTAHLAATPALSSGDSGADASGCTVSTSGGGASGSMKRRWRARAGGAPVACCVPGCCELLDASAPGALNKYALRHRVCLPHLRAESVDTGGGPCRFCQARRASPAPKN